MNKYVKRVSEKAIKREISRDRTRQQERKQSKECAHKKKRNIETGKRSVVGMDAKQEDATSIIFSANDLHVRVCGRRAGGGGGFQGGEELHKLKKDTLKSQCGHVKN